MKNSEINDFRWRVRLRCEEIADQRSNGSWIDKVKYKYPVRIEPMKEIPLYLKDHLSSGTIKIQTRIKLKDPIEMTVNYMSKTVDLIKLAFQQYQLDYDENNYTFKIFGQEEYLLDCQQLINYKVCLHSLNS